ncbi:MAG: DUF655 domain-containing protein [Nitrosopumilus sp.]|nr:DUF655 domain-containing protein [Nitrosopumilus sp.]MDA7960367.1 DUF655 domain-containing protein [Nitrosopumilus sp.]MDA7998894.1 DUF655 domain-containing protein [Nitrosopumilus sp.]
MLDFNPRGRSLVSRGRSGALAVVIGEGRLVLLEVETRPGASPSPGDRMRLSGADGPGEARVVGRVEYRRLPRHVQNLVGGIVEQIVRSSEARFVDYVNRAGPVSQRAHALEMIPGVGSTVFRVILDERGRAPFSSYKDIEERTGLRDPAGRLAERMTEEVEGRTRVSLFAQR